MKQIKEALQGLIIIFIGYYAYQAYMSAPKAETPSVSAALDPVKQAAKQAANGVKRGLIDRYFDVCQPWRGWANKLDTFHANGLDSESDDALIAGELSAHSVFDELAAKNGKASACASTLKSLKKQGATL